MQKKYNKDYKIIIFKINDYITLIILKKNQTSTDNIHILIKVLNI